MTSRYAERMGGTLLLEYPIIWQRPGVGWRRVDAIIIQDRRPQVPTEDGRISLDGHDVIVVQTKAHRLAMPVLGQALFSRDLVIREFKPTSVRTVALCTGDDTALNPIAKRYRIDVEFEVDELAKPRTRPMSARTPARRSAASMMTRRYAERVGGTLLNPYAVIDKLPDGATQQWVEAIILPSLKHPENSNISLKGHDVIIVHARERRLGMPLMGQALFSRELVEKYCKPSSIRTVALCTEDDNVLGPIAKRYGIEVAEEDQQAAPAKRTGAGKSARKARAG